MALSPQQYDDWYRTRRGRWISEREFALIIALLRPMPGARLLDVGCGTGHFSRRFVATGLQVTGIDPDSTMLDVARRQNDTVNYVQGKAQGLPFADEQFDYGSAVTSLCFVQEPVSALQEMWRVSKKGIILGLLNRHSRLYYQKHGRGAYEGARWDTGADVLHWLTQGGIESHSVVRRSAIFFPSGNLAARIMDAALPSRLPWGAFLAVYVDKSFSAAH